MNPLLKPNLLEEEFAEELEEFWFLAAEKFHVVGDKFEGHVFFDFDAFAGRVGQHEAEVDVDQVALKYCIQDLFLNNLLLLIFYWKIIIHIMYYIY